MDKETIMFDILSAEHPQLLAKILDNKGLTREEFDIYNAVMARVNAMLT